MNRPMTRPTRTGQLSKNDPTQPGGSENLGPGKTYPKPLSQRPISPLEEDLLLPDRLPIPPRRKTKKPILETPKSSLSMVQTA